MKKEKIKTVQSEDYTTGCLLDYHYIKNHYRLIEANPKQFKKYNSLDNKKI